MKVIVLAESSYYCTVLSFITYFLSLKIENYTGQKKKKTSGVCYFIFKRTKHLKISSSFMFYSVLFKALHSLLQVRIILSLFPSLQSSMLLFAKFPPFIPIFACLYIYYDRLVGLVVSMSDY